jgi:hypothetical protein
LARVRFEGEIIVGQGSSSGAPGFSPDSPDELNV